MKAVMDSSCTDSDEMVLLEKAGAFSRPAEVAKSQVKAVAAGMEGD